MRSYLLPLLVAGALGASPVQAASINHAYRIAGDPAAAPIQAFDDGTQLFLQLRDVRRPPVPTDTENRPMLYEIRAPYMLLPLTDKVRLRYGAQQASVDALPRAKAETRATPDRNLWFGGATPDRQTGEATPPVPAATARVVEPGVIREKQRAQEFSGSIRSAMAQPVVTTFNHSHAEPFDAAAAARVVSFVAGRKASVSGDGSLSGYRRGKDIVAMLERTGLKAEWAERGAPRGRVRIQVTGAPAEGSGDDVQGQIVVSSRGDGVTGQISSKGVSK